MKIKRAVKTALAVALSAVITFGIVGGSAVKSYAGFTYCSHHDEQDLFIPQGGSVTVTGTKSDVQPVNVITSVIGLGTDIFVDSNFSGNDFTITVSAANTAAIGSHNHIDISHEGENIRLYIKVTERVDLVNNPDIYNQSLFFHIGDLTDTSSLNRLLENVRPDEIYNLASQSHVDLSFELPEYTAQVNSLGTLRLLDAIKQNDLRGTLWTEKF